MRILFAIAALLCANSLFAGVTQVDVTGIVHPVTVDIISAALAQAESQHADAVIIRLSTPGGLLDSTREIVERIFRSPIPVIMWVGPAGARAASAGFFLLEAGDVAAMSPGSNTGASHPVSASGADLDSVMNQKVENDTAALMRTIAAHRGRNVDAAEKTVRASVSYTESEARDQHLIDLDCIRSCFVTPRTRWPRNHTFRWAQTDAAFDERLDRRIRTGPSPANSLCHRRSQYRATAPGTWSVGSLR